MYHEKVIQHKNPVFLKMRESEAHFPMKYSLFETMRRKMEIKGEKSREIFLFHF